MSVLMASVISSLLSSGASLEASAYPKPGNVHRLADFWDTRYEDFLLSAHLLHPVLLSLILEAVESGRGSVGRAVYASVRLAKFAGVRGNACLGLSTILSPLAAGVGLCLREGVVSVEGVVRFSGVVLGRCGVEDALFFYRAIREVSPSYLGRHVGGRLPDVFDPGFEREIRSRGITLIDVFSESSSWDLVSRELIEGYPRCLWVREFLRRGRYSMDWNSVVVHAYLHLLSREIDGLVLRRGGRGVAERLRVMARRALALGGLLTEEGRRYVRRLDSWLRSRGLNPGSVADIIAGGIALYNLEEFIRSGGLDGLGSILRC